MVLTPASAPDERAGQNDNHHRRSHVHFAALRLLGKLKWSDIFRQPSIDSPIVQVKIAMLIEGRIMRAWIFGVLSACFAVVSSADVVKMTSGSEIECVVIQENADSVVIRRGYGTISIPRSQIESISKSPILTASAVAPTTRRTVGQRMPPWNDVLLALVKTKWATNVQQIPATVIDAGVMRHVPYQSYRCGGDYEVNVYGDPDRPASIEIGIYGGLLNKNDAKLNCIELVASVLSDKTDAAIVRGLNQAQDLVSRNGLTFEITPPTSPDAYGGWWVSVYSETELNGARASEDELKQITVAKAPPPAPTPTPAARTTGSAAATPRTSSPTPRTAVDSDDWTASDFRYARATKPTTATTIAGGGTVYVRGYYRKDGTYVRPHTRRR
jgi:hypothetical protein